MSKTSEKTTRMVLIALFSAIIIAMTYVPYTGYINYGGISITTIHIPVIIGAILFGPRDGLILGTVWGLSCMILALMTPLPQNAIFINPLISVVPRMIVGFVAGFAGSKLKSVVKKDSIRYIITAIIGTLTNTVLVLSAIGLFAGDAIIPMGKTIKEIFMVLVSINGVIEMFAAIIIVPVICTALTKAKVVKNLSN